MAKRVWIVRSRTAAPVWFVCGIVAGKTEWKAAKWSSTAEFYAQTRMKLLYIDARTNPPLG